MAPIIEIDQLSKTYNSVKVLNRTSLVITASDGVVALTGPNAAGKTTLFNVITGVTQPDNDPPATVRVFGVLVTQTETWRIARMGVARLFQDARVFLGMTVLQNAQIAAGGRAATAWHSLLRRLDGREAAMKALEFVGLASRSLQRADVLSLGDRRKLAIACMLQADARLLLLDEPTANLDANATSQMKGLILSLAAQGKHIVLIEHNHEFVRDVAQTVFTFNQGRCNRNGASDMQYAPTVEGGL